MTDYVAGTIHLHDPEKEVDEKTSVLVEHDEVIHRTKTGTVYKTRHGRELIPTPSNDPNDPLNWPQAWKLLVLFSVCMSSLMVAFCAAGIIPGFGEIVSLEYHLGDGTADITSTGRGVRYQHQQSRLPSVGQCLVACSRTYHLGPSLRYLRPTSSLSNGHAHYLGELYRMCCCKDIRCASLYKGMQAIHLLSLTSMLTCSQMLQGFGASGAIAVGAGSIADVFFLHERGLYNGIWIAIAQSGPFISPMITGEVIQEKGWRWSLWLMAIFAGVFLVLIFCCLPETL